MKSIYIFSLFISAMLVTPHLLAQEVAPLKLGNIWVYNEYPSISRTTVVDANIFIDTVSYYKLFREYNRGGLNYFLYMRLKQDGDYAFRMDTSYPAPNHEKIYWKENAVLGDTWENPAPYFPLIYTVLDTFATSVFGAQVTVKQLEIDGSLVLFEEFWTEEFGKLSRSDFGTPISSLQGCVIDGVAYGDTSFLIVGVDNENVLPEDFHLSQNYPNPFNPVTTINYSIKKDRMVALSVYDILGKEVATLLNERKTAGSYSVIFNASHLPSGIYFYKLVSGNFSETRKLILLK